MKELSLKNAMKGAKYKTNKRCLSADGFSLLPSALRPRLFWLVIGIGILTLNSVCCGGDRTFALYSATMTTSGGKSIDVSPSNGGVSISADAISVSTNCRAGYNLSVATSVNDNNLYYDGSSSNNATGTYFTPVDGTNTLDNSNNVNKWGYYYNSSNSTAPTKTSIFSAVPAFNGTPATLVTPTSSETDISDSFNVYYGVAVNSNLKVGTYKMIQDTNNNNNNGSIIYYLTMAESCMPYTVQFNPTSTANNTTLSGTGTMSSQTIPVGEAINLNSNTFTPPSGYKFKEWNTVQDGTGTAYADGASVTDLTSGGGTTTLYAQWEEAGIVLYNEVAAMSKGVQTPEQLQAAITVPTSADRTEDTSNSGVYEYDARVFGSTADLEYGYNIYYYRGVLENAVGSYGSDGSAVTYPNYVVLSSASNKSGLANTDTCWRIVRTTGSGGVKMIYNGTWTGSTCANAATAAQLAGTQVFGLKGSSSSNQNTWYLNINRVGYTFNNDSSMQDSTTETSVYIVFGNDKNPSINNARSNIKTYIEDTWYANNMTAYTDILEPSAGYCNDRSLYNVSSILDDYEINGVETIEPFRPSDRNTYFGAYLRNIGDTASDIYLSLDCPRRVVDLYSYVKNSDGVANELKYPTALLTADEASLAGSGGGGTGSAGFAYHDNSYLNSGKYFWLLSPGRVGKDQGVAQGLVVGGEGGIVVYNVGARGGARPVISLARGTYVMNGNGTATNPWIVNPPNDD